MYDSANRSQLMQQQSRDDAERKQILEQRLQAVMRSLRVERRGRQHLRHLVAAQAKAARQAAAANQVYRSALKAACQEQRSLQQQQRSLQRQVADVTQQLADAAAERDALRDGDVLAHAALLSQQLVAMQQQLASLRIEVQTLMDSVELAGELSRCLPVDISDGTELLGLSLDLADSLRMELVQQQYAAMVLASELQQVEEMLGITRQQQQQQVVVEQEGMTAATQLQLLASLQECKQVTAQLQACRELLFQLGVEDVPSMPQPEAFQPVEEEQGEGAVAPAAQLQLLKWELGTQVSQSGSLQQQVVELRAEKAALHYQAAQLEAQQQQLVSQQKALAEKLQNADDLVASLFKQLNEATAGKDTLACQPAAADGTMAALEPAEAPQQQQWRREPGAPAAVDAAVAAAAVSPVMPPGSLGAPSMQQQRVRRSAPGVSKRVQRQQQQEGEEVGGGVSDDSHQPADQVAVSQRQLAVSQLRLVGVQMG
jgi:hypothetical protein